MIRTRPLSDGTAGIKRRISLALEASPVSMSMGELIAKLDIDKRYASDVSSALYKLVAQGKVSAAMGAATAAKGRRLVRRYKWIGEVLEVSITQPDKFYALRMLGVTRC